MWPGLCSQLIHSGSEATACYVPGPVPATGLPWGWRQTSPALAELPLPCETDHSPQPRFGLEGDRGQVTRGCGQVQVVPADMAHRLGITQPPGTPHSDPEALQREPQEAGWPSRGFRQVRQGGGCPGPRPVEGSPGCIPGEGRPSGAGAGSVGSGLCLKRPLAAAWRQECRGRGSRRPWGLGRPWSLGRRVELYRLFPSAGNALRPGRACEGARLGFKSISPSLATQARGRLAYLAGPRITSSRQPFLSTHHTGGFPPPGVSLPFGHY